jgi:hypothetical protein
LKLKRPISPHLLIYKWEKNIEFFK